MMENERTFRLLPVLVVLVLSSSALFFSSFGINRSFWFDECCSVEIANASWAGIIENLKTNAHTPPLYYFLLKIWMALFGAGEAGARSLSALFYLFSIPPVYFLGKALFDRKHGVFCACLFLVNPMAVQFAQFARMYSLLSLLAILSTLFFVQQFYSGQASKKNWAVYVAVNMAGTFTHYWFFFLLLAHGVAYFLLFSKSSLKSFALAMLLSIIPFFALWTPILWTQMTNGGTSEIARPGFSTLLNTLLIFWGEGKKAIILYAVFLMLGCMNVSGRRLKFQSFQLVKEFFQQKQVLTLILLLAVSLGIPWLVSQIKPIYMATKYPMMVLFAAVMLIGAWLARLGNQRAVAAFCLMLLVAVAAGLVMRRLHPPAASVRSATDYLLEHGGRGDILVLSTSGLGGTQYYLKRAGAEGHFAQFPFPAEMARHPCWPNLNEWTKSYLENEVDSLVRRIEASFRTGQEKIWLLNGHLPKIDTVVKNRLDVRFQPMEEKFLGSSYLPLRDRLFVYQKKPAGGRPPSGAAN